MGAICAVKYATIYCALREEEIIIPKYNDNLLFFRRYIDAYGIIKVLIAGKTLKRTLHSVSSTGRSLSQAKQFTFLTPQSK